MANNLHKMINVDVVFPLPYEQRVFSVSLEKGSTIREAIEKSGILSIYPQIDLKENQVGVFSEEQELHSILHDGDRVEIYRPLLLTPEALRKMRRIKSK